MRADFPFSKGRGQIHYRDTSVANQPFSPVKANLQGSAEKAKTAIVRSKRGSLGKGLIIPNQLVTDGPPKAAGWQSTRRPKEQLHGRR